MKRHRILQITPYYPPDYEFGGPVKLVSEINELLIKKYDISVYTYNFRHDNKLIYSDKIEVRRFIPLSRLLSKKFNFYYSTALINALKKNIQNFSLVHTHDYRSFHNIALTKLCKKNNIPVIMSSYKSINPNTGQVCFKKIYDSLFGNKIINNVDHFIAVSRFEEQDILNFNVLKNKITIIPNCIKKNNSVYPSNSFRKKYNISNEKKILLFFSRLHKYKKPNIAVESFAIVHKHHPNVLLVIFGPDGGELKELQKKVQRLQIEKDVVFIPKAAEPDDFAVYNDSYLLILPSPYNEFPLVLIEAMAHGLPIITSEQSIEKYIHNKCGRVISCDATIYAKNIIDLLCKDKEHQKYKQQAVETFLHNFTIEKYIEKLQILYAKFLE